MDLTAGKKAFLLIGFHVDSIDEVSRKRIEKQLDNIDISKVTTFTTAQEMV